MSTKKSEIETAKHAAALFKPWAEEDREHFMVLFLDSDNVPIEDTPRIIAVGDEDSVGWDGPDFWRVGYDLNAKGVIVAHNHPHHDKSKDTDKPPMPSDQDWQLTKQVYLVGSGLGIDLLDHLVIDPVGFMSLRRGERWNWDGESVEMPTMVEPPEMPDDIKDTLKSIEKLLKDSGIEYGGIIDGPGGITLPVKNEAKHSTPAIRTCPIPATGNNAWRVEAAALVELRRLCAKHATATLEFQSPSHLTGLLDSLCEAEALDDLTGRFPDPTVYKDRPAVELSPPGKGIPTVWALGWRSGEWTPIHDHDGSFARIQVVRGNLDEKEYTLETPLGLDSWVASVKNRTYPGDSRLNVPREYIHEMGNGSGPCVLSVHVYWEPLTRMGLYTRKDTPDGIPTLTRSEPWTPEEVFSE